MRSISAVDPPSTTVQKMPMTDAACESPVGITTLDERSSSNHGAGSSHRSFTAGPVGPLNGPRLALAPSTVVTDPGERIVRVGDLIRKQHHLRCDPLGRPVVLSHPNPSQAPLPR